MNVFSIVSYMTEIDLKHKFESNICRNPKEPSKKSIGPVWVEFGFWMEEERYTNDERKKGSDSKRSYT